MFGKMREAENVENLVGEGRDNRRLRQIFDGSLYSHRFE